MPRYGTGNSTSDVPITVTHNLDFEKPGNYELIINVGTGFGL